MSTTQRPDSSYHSGKTRSHHDQKKDVISGTQAVCEETDEEQQVAPAARDRVS